jgi:hypothetical protein
LSVSGGHETGEIVRQEVLEGGRLELWQRLDGVWGVSLLPNYGHRHYPGVNFTPGKDAPRDFPSGRQPDIESVLAWARAVWQREGFGEPVDEG